MAKVGDIIYHVCTTDANLSTLGDRIYPVIADQNPNPPFLVYTMIGSEYEPTKDKHAQVVRRMSLAVWHTNYDLAYDLAEQLRASFDFRQEKAMGLERARIQDMADIGFNPDVNVFGVAVTLDFTIWPSL